MRSDDSHCLLFDSTTRVRFICLTVDAIIGFFGAAWFGVDTSGNILQNNLGNVKVQAFINISIARALFSSYTNVASNFE